MAIEIKELYIKINVKEGPNKESSNSGQETKDNKEAIISTSIEEVMELLEKQKER
ncbi:DUF5908 family protein [Tenacibaculum xiamenense]|uniref:DUF5908 family protein n=1 Tax=Tenacibaculum xiamenense TaxID=1261553 RepID=UPI003894E5A5